jgi:hypothetical protein
VQLHACFLLGLADIGKDLIDHVYKLGESKCDINTPYMSDLDPWKVMGVLDEHDHFDDGGLYTGETCLHIAIVQSVSAGDASLVEWMLQRGAHITCRATGSFFKGKVIKLRSGRKKGGSEDLDVQPRGSVQGRARFDSTQFKTARDTHLARGGVCVLQLASTRCRSTCVARANRPYCKLTPRSNFFGRLLVPRIWQTPGRNR